MGHGDGWEYAERGGAVVVTGPQRYGGDACTRQLGAAECHRARWRASSTCAVWTYVRVVEAPQWWTRGGGHGGGHQAGRLPSADSSRAPDEQRFLAGVVDTHPLSFLFFMHKGRGILFVVPRGDVREGHVNGSESPATTARPNNSASPSSEAKKSAALGMQIYRGARVPARLPVAPLSCQPLRCGSLGRWRRGGTRCR